MITNITFNVNKYFAFAAGGWMVVSVISALASNYPASIAASLITFNFVVMGILIRKF